jgi:hypothetical protein
VNILLALSTKAYRLVSVHLGPIRRTRIPDDNSIHFSLQIACIHETTPRADLGRSVSAQEETEFRIIDGLVLVYRKNHTEQAAHPGYFNSRSAINRAGRWLQHEQQQAVHLVK